VTAIMSWPQRVLVDQLYYGSMVRFPWLAPSLSVAVARGLGALPRSIAVTVAENARLALGPTASDAQVRLTVDAILRGMQDSIRDTLLSDREDVDSLRARVAGFRGQEGYYRARARGGGLLLASIHMGAFEPCLALLRKYERRVHVLFQPDPMRGSSARAAVFGGPWGSSSTGSPTALTPGSPFGTRSRLVRPSSCMRIG